MLGYRGCASEGEGGGQGLKAHLLHSWGGILLFVAVAQALTCALAAWCCPQGGAGTGDESAQIYPSLQIQLHTNPDPLVQRFTVFREKGISGPLSGFWQQVQTHLS